ncbi:VOC family protein [Lichenifustis flavocetrariae]|uniref:VOC family protein n=1 Tax=Lichenifustis flavocetrariae TaxID=2949735 RepID=A0AA41YY87_9HYPH|nr:VOC family protein [Lichenifustis flavocetrariae]MCW6509253.1 VOC family protein [Lichenifustis flavocetrariae]
MTDRPPSSGLPGLAGVEHTGLTVPDMDEATAFFVDILGAEVLFEVGPFSSDDDWMATHLGVHPRAKIPRLRMLRLAEGPSIELFEYISPDQQHTRSRNSDAGGHHLAFYVADVTSAVEYLKRYHVEVLGEPTTMLEGPSAGLTWVYFRAPWGLQLELVSAPRGLAYERSGDRPMWRPDSEGRSWALNT